MTKDFLSKKDRTYQQGQYTVELFPEQYIYMMEEIHNYHPKLWPIVQGAKDVAAQLEETAAYCDYLVQGQVKVAELCELLLRELKGKRGSIILLN